RRLAGWTGWRDEGQVLARVREEAQRRRMPDRKSGRRASAQHSSTTASRDRQDSAARPDPRDPTLSLQREALKLALQYPVLAGPVFDALTVECFTHPGYAAVRTAIDVAGGAATGGLGVQWIDAVRQKTLSLAAAGLVNELSVEAIRVDEGDKLQRYIAGVLARLQEVWVGRQVAEVKSKLQRMSPVEQGD
ncbi:MAG: DNA primase, partial [Mycobacterium sp.]|nr:DNA primase [Mycobacterium sp.]